MWHLRRGTKAVAAVLGAGAFFTFAEAAFGQTLEAALLQAYENNPTLNAQRAAVRATDENVPRALSGYRPTVSGTASAGLQTIENKAAGAAGGATTTTNLQPTSLGITANQTLYNGLRTGNAVRAAESQVSEARENLRATEQTVLLGAVTAYMNVLRDTSLVELQRQNVQALREQLRVTRDRFDVGEVTRTDTALAEAAAAGAQSALIQAQANLIASQAVYRQTIGTEPGRLLPGRPIDPLLPKTLDAGLGIGLQRHPTILTAQYAVDVANFQVKIAEANLLPILNAQGILNRSTDQSPLIARSKSATGLLTLSVPLYQGGIEYANIRQAKELLGQARIQAEVIRDQVRASLVQFWGLLEAARAGIEAAQTQVNAQTIALNGIIEEWKVGQRTLLDVLNARAQLVTAQANLVTAQRDRVVASYSVLSAIGKLDMESLGLKVATYQPEEHYHQVRDSWFGLRTPDGR
jgi:outer membrane protein